MGMGFRGLVWKRVWIITFLGLKLGQNFKNQAAHPHQEFPGVPPPPPPGLWLTWELIILEMKPDNELAIID